MLERLYFPLLPRCLCCGIAPYLEVSGGGWTGLPIPGGGEMGFGEKGTLSDLGEGGGAVGEGVIGGVTERGLGTGEGVESG